MQVKENQVFNLIDTNGRRKDVINALQTYLSILNDSTKDWAPLPKSTAQYEFYKKSLELSSNTFKKYSNWENLIAEINKYPDFKYALENDHILWIQNNQIKYKNLIKQFDNGIEDRARHHTSNLVKWGFTDNKRNISPIGEQLLKKKSIERDFLEKFIPIDIINVVYLRQLLKLKIFNKNYTQFYSPFNMAIYLLLNKNRVSEKEFLELIQGLNPYFDFNDIDNLIINYKQGEIYKTTKLNIPAIFLNNQRIEKNIFKKYYTNGKQDSKTDVYWIFYNYLIDFIEHKDDKTLQVLLDFYSTNKYCVNKAFGRGKNFLNIKKQSKILLNEFITNNQDILKNNINEYLYNEFILSKRADQIREYSDTTKRIFKATGIISFDNGYVELAYKELLNNIFDIETIKNLSFGNYTSGEDYEGDINSYFCSVKSVCEILQYTKEQIDDIVRKIKNEFENKDIIDITEIIAQKRKEEFIKHINEKFPVAETKNILKLFKDRSNDNLIKDKVSSIATIPTIYKFMVGIAWYYFSGKQIDILNSYNLTLSADFEPLVHAGGGQGDMVIYEEDKVIMLEATLMNSNSQKRGEWEPVLRHSVNLKVEEETQNTNRIVTTFFIADEFDPNTINIWKAVAAVPLQSSINRENYTDNVVIMPIDTSELCVLIDKSDMYNEIINNVHDLFKVDKNSFNMNWRDEFIKEIING